jgi:hypothetical protein
MSHGAHRRISHSLRNGETFADDMLGVIETNGEVTLPRRDPALTRRQWHYVAAVAVASGVCALVARFRAH